MEIQRVVTIKLKDTNGAPIIEVNAVSPLPCEITTTYFKIPTDNPAAPITLEIEQH